MRRGSGGAISLILTFPRTSFIRWDKAPPSGTPQTDYCYL